MIKRRPPSLLADAVYKTLPKLPLSVDWTSIPELVRVSIRNLCGIQPVTKALLNVAGGADHDTLSDCKAALFRERGTEFQLISVVLNCVPADEFEGALLVRPFSVTLIPGSKRGQVDVRRIDGISSVDASRWLASQPIYCGFDPFSGEWSLYGNMPSYLDGVREGFLDEVGIVVNQYFLATRTPDDDEIATTDMHMPTTEMKERYERHRNRLLFTPFEQVEARRVWGAQTPLELFLLQGLASERLYPECQILIMEDGAVFPSLYHLWQDREFRHGAALVTEADLYFPKQKLAVFCDGAHHSRRKQRAKDEAITKKLTALGIGVVRIPSTDIKLDLPRAVASVRGAL